MIQDDDDHPVYSRNLQAIVNSLEEYIEASLITNKVSKQQCEYCKKILLIINEADSKDHETIFALTYMYQPEEAYLNLLKMGFNHS